MYRDRYDVDVLLFLEHKDRELEVIIEIAKELKNSFGLSIAIASTVYHIINASVFVRPKVVVFPSYPGMMSIYYEMYGESITYVCLNWEQMLSIFNKKRRRPKDLFTKTTLKHCVWGNNFKQFLKENAVKEKNIFITGRPANTLLNKKVLKHQQIRKELSQKFHLDNNMKWLFFPMTCLHAFFGNYHVRSFIDDEISKEMAFSRRTYVKETLEIIFKWIHSLGKIEQKNFIIILRPHPAVSIQQYEELFNKVGNGIPSYVRIQKELTAQEWLIASDACYTNYSSLALDAYSIKKEAYLLEPKPFPSYLKYQWFDGFKKINKFEEFCSSIHNNNNSYPKRHKVVKQEFELSLKGIIQTAKVISELVSKQTSFPKASFSGFVKAVMHSPKRPLGSLLRYMAMKTFLSKMVKSGLHSDFFDSREIKALLKSKV